MRDDSMTFGEFLTLAICLPIVLAAFLGSIGFFLGLDWSWPYVMSAYWFGLR